MVGSIEVFRSFSGGILYLRICNAKLVKTLNSVCKRLFPFSRFLLSTTDVCQVLLTNLRYVLLCKTKPRRKRIIRYRNSLNSRDRKQETGHRRWRDLLLVVLVKMLNLIPTC